MLEESSPFQALLSAEFGPHGVLSKDQLDELERHYNLLMRWNERMNLTRIRSLEDVVQLHYGESLFLGRALPANRLRIIDVGSGAGFPGIPVAILRPDCSVHLSESHQRKSVFLQEASRHLSNVRVLPQRAESLEPGYDWVIARAVRPAQILALGLAPNAALMVGEADASELQGSVIRTPWGSKRRLVKFHVEQTSARDKI